MADSLANVALETLRDLLVEETKLLLSVSGEVEQVKRDLRIIHAMLMKADRKGSDSPTLKEYANQLKDLALKAENVLETYAVKVASKKQSHSLKEKLKRYSCILCECFNVHEVGRDVRDIITRLADLTGKFESELGQESSRHENEADLARLTLAHEVEPLFVGMEKEIKDLVSMVKDERRVIKIYGMGGLGKTTVARKVYNHPELASYGRAWACVTQNFQPKAFLGNILRQLEKNEQGIGDSMDVASLMDRVCRVLGQMKKSMLVIDDIWEDEHWEMIKKVVPTNCYVLLTTRNEFIANQESHPYKLKFLTEDEGWDLLRKISIGLAPPRPDETKSLEKTGRQIVVKCGYLPLSISVIGGILRQKEQTLAEWEKVNTSIGSYLRHGEGVGEYKKVKLVLELSYDALPYYLKSCFLYLACFPEDHEIETEKLYLSWMAEGFISHEDKGHNESLTDVAERYLSELAMRCMVQVDKSLDYSSLDYSLVKQVGSPFKKFDSCRLHDLMHDLCSSKAEKENLLKRLKVSNFSSPIVNSTNRLVIINDSDTPKLGVKGLEEVEDLRSFMFLGNYEHLGETIMIDLERSPCLRILVIEHCEFEDGKLPNKVGKLIHLRYLSLWNSSVRELPKFVCGMPYLQTLDLRVTYSDEALRLPNEIWKMKKLKHMFLPMEIEVIGGAKLRLDGLEELETLEGINSETACVADIPKLMMSLRKVCVVVGDMDSMSTILQVMSNNNDQSRPWELVLDVGELDLRKDVVEKVLMFPWLSSLRLSECNVSGGFPCYEQGMAQNLVSFDIYCCKVTEEDMNVNVMEVLGNYPKLKTLTLYEVEFANTETFICPSNSFPQLHYLHLNELPNIKKWEVEQGAMPKLVEIIIDRCINMEKLPDGLRFISTLERLLIFNMPEEFKERVIGQDSATVSHIPHVHIY